jgi:hypothetical protein
MNIEHVECVPQPAHRYINLKRDHVLSFSKFIFNILKFEVFDGQCQHLFEVDDRLEVWIAFSI